jgi:hypothetical protein
MHICDDTGRMLDMEDEKKGKKEKKIGPFWFDGHIFAAFGLD